MKRCFSGAMLLFLAASALADEALVQRFQSPPEECRPDVFFQVMGGSITKEGLTKDLEAMQRQGIGGVLLMQMPDQLAGVVQWPFRDYPGKKRFPTNGSICGTSRSASVTAWA
jgi:hypothetical protein